MEVIKYGTNLEHKIPPEHKVTKSNMSYVALVIGSTGAVGRDLVAELVASAKCAKVIALTRREIPESKWPTAFPALDVAQAQSKLEIRAVEFDQLASDSQVLIKPDEKVDAAFSCLGTTRKGAFERSCGLWSIADRLH